MSESVRDLLVRAIAAAKAGDRLEARHYLEWALHLDPTEEQRVKAWLWLSQVSDAPVEKRRYLEQILATDPTHPEARRALAILDGRLKPDEVIDPNRLTIAAPDAPQPAQARQFICRRCGGRMVYNPQGQLICEYCQQHQAASSPPAEDEPIEEQDFILALATARGHVHPVAMRCLSCRACGASFALPPEILSFTCPYCAAVYSVEQAEVQELMPPAAIIPFVIGQSEAEHILLRWLQMKPHASFVRAAPLVGTYVPAWTFDLRCQVVERYPGHEQVFLLNDVPVPAGRKLPAPLLDEVERFDLSGLLPYDPRYLAGWMAETYQISPADASLTARQKVAARAPRGGKISLFVESFKLILLPLWITHYRDGERQYTLIINGQSGALRSDRPQKVGRGWLSWLMGKKQYSQRP